MHRLDCACCGQIGPLRRFVAISFTTGSLLALYMVINRCQFVPRATVAMPSWVPFWPAFMYLYVGMMLVTWLLPVAIRDAGLFRACLWSYVCAYLLVMPWWLFIPTTLPRPPLPQDWWAGVYRVIAALDPPNNIVPCAHGIGPMVGAWFAGRDRPTWRWPLAGILVLGLPSIFLSWQHRPIDILLGLAPTAIGIAVGEALHRRGQRPPASTKIILAKTTLLE